MDFNPLPNEPYWPTLAELNYPPQVKKLIDQANKVWDIWAEADTALIVANDELKLDKSNFEESILQAARKGDAIPSKPDFETAENRIKYLAEVARTKRTAVDLAVNELTTGLQNHRVEIAILAIDKAKTGMAKYESSIKAIAEQLPVIEEARRAAYDGLTMMSDLSSPELRFVPEFGVGGNAQLPNTHEASAKSIIKNLETFLIEPNLEVPKSED